MQSEWMDTVCCTMVSPSRYHTWIRMARTTSRRTRRAGLSTTDDSSNDYEKPLCVKGM